MNKSGVFLIIMMALSMVIPGRSEAKTMYKTAIFAGGCFWCIEDAFEGKDGVISVTSGYTGGHKQDPTYEEVSSGTTGHYEAVKVVYDPAKTTYKKLLDIFWKQIDPTDPGGQFSDRGSQYRTAIFYDDGTQKQEAESSRDELAAFGLFEAPIVTSILPAMTFYPAEAYHQDYSKTCPLKYRLYKKGSGREGFIKRVWPSE